MNKLLTVAHDMKRDARRTALAVRELPHGLRLELVCAGGQYTLTLSRPCVRPSEEEVSLCRVAFSVPGDARLCSGDTTTTLRWSS